MTTTNKTLFDGLTESRKQSVIGKFFNDRIYVRSFMVDSLMYEHSDRSDILGGEFTWDNVNNLYTSVDCKSDCECSEYFDSEVEERNWNKTLCDCEETAKEVYEWYQVEPCLYDYLTDKGECTLNTSYGRFWGRCTTGQSWVLDNVLHDIFNDMDEHVQHMWIKE